MHHPSHYKRTTHKSKKKKDTEQSPAILAKNLLKSLSITLATGLILILGASLIAYFTVDPNSVILPLSLAASALTALIGGFAAARINGSGAMLTGLLNGCVMMAIMILVSLFLGKHATGYSTAISFLLHAAFLLLSAMGGLLGQKRAKPRHRKR